jgi:predicted DNA-binding transcriptional regulator
MPEAIRIAEEVRSRGEAEAEIEAGTIRHDNVFVGELLGLLRGSMRMRLGDVANELDLGMESTRRVILYLSRRGMVGLGSTRRKYGWVIWRVGK